MDASEVEEGVRDRIVNGLPAADRPRAARLIEARRHLRDAGNAFQAERFSEARGALISAIRSAPWLLASPIWGPQLLMSTAKATAAAALPGQAGVRARRAIKDVRIRLGRNPVEPGLTPPSGQGD